TAPSPVFPSPHLRERCFDRKGRPLSHYVKENQYPFFIWNSNLTSHLHFNMLNWTSGPDPSPSSGPSKSSFPRTPLSRSQLQNIISTGVPTRYPDPVASLENLRSCVQLCCGTILALPMPYHVICDFGHIETLAHSHFIDETIGAQRGDLSREPDTELSMGDFTEY
ncbi:hypothetical protein H1C71_037671, partial [Ictidomys tridecemlineatus]